MSDVDKYNYRYSDISCEILLQIDVSHHTPICFHSGDIALKKKKQKIPQVSEVEKKYCYWILPCRAYNNASSGTLFRNTLYNTRFRALCIEDIAQFIIHFLYSTSNSCNNNNYYYYN